MKGWKKVRSVKEKMNGCTSASLKKIEESVGKMKESVTWFFFWVNIGKYDSNCS